MPDDIAAGVGDAADSLQRETIRVPANLMGLLRQSYDSREKALDWLLAIGVTAALAYAFREQISAALLPPADPNAGRTDAPYPNQNLADAFPYGPAGRGPDRLYTYAMPSSRSIRYGIGPSGTRPPSDPSAPPSLSAEGNEP